MPKLTGEELSALYPKAKTYDELQEERRLRDLERRPTFVKEKIALYTSLGIPTVFVAYFIVQRTSEALFREGANTGPVLTGVCFSILTLLVATAALYYLYTLINGLASKVFLDTSLLYLLLITVLCAGIGIGVFLVQAQGYNFMLTAAAATLATFALSFAAGSLFKKYE